ncbi:unnamed protein product [Calypogeia fissa]
MGLFSRGRSILATSISRNVNWRKFAHVIGARVHFCKSRKGSHGVAFGVRLPDECADAKQEQRQVLRKPVDVLPTVSHPALRPVEIDQSVGIVVGIGCSDGVLNSQGLGFRGLSQKEEVVQHVENHIPRHMKNWEIDPVGIVGVGCGDGELNSQGLRFTVLSHGEERIQHLESKNCGKSLELGNVKEIIKCKGLGSDMDQTTACANLWETAKKPHTQNSLDGVFTSGEESIMQGRNCGPNYLEIENVLEIDRKIVDIEVEQRAESDLTENGKLKEREAMVEGVDIGIVSEFSETSVSKNFNRSITREEDAIPTEEIQLVQNTNEVNVPLGVEEGDYSQYPVPLSPLSGELAKSIEYERAMVAEAAVKSGPAMTRSGVLFEDEWLIVINKPCGVYCEHVLATIPSLLIPAADFSSVSRLTLRRPADNKDESVPHLHMANRLDRDTSGVMVITKCRNAAGKLSNIFTKRKVQKSYVALCIGPRPSWKSVTVDSGHGRSRYGAWRVYSKRDVGRRLPGGSVVRDMTTHLVVLSINKQLVLDDQIGGSSISDTVSLKDMEYLVTAGDENPSTVFGHSSHEKPDLYSKDSLNDSQPTIKDDEIVILAIPLTGRTHQIRLHCQFVGLPLRGDVKYGGPHFLDGVRYDHHALHAETLSFRHPFTFEELHFVAPLPQWALDAGVQPLVIDDARD